VRAIHCERTEWSDGKHTKAAALISTATTMAMPLVRTALLTVPAHQLPAPRKRTRSVTIPAELEAQILRYYHVERWLPNTIARQLNVHYGTVARVLARAGLPRLGRPRPSRIDPYLPFILATLEKFPTLTASRLYGMVHERGYAGGPDHFRHVISRHRPRPKAEAYLRLRTLPAEQAQVDWAHFGRYAIGRAARPLMAFVMVLSFSRAIVLRFFLNASLENFLRAHVAAFETWGGLPRTLLYDNLKSVVLERQGDAIRFHPTLLEFAAHYRFEPRPVAIARGNEKGRVERAVRYIRSAFFAGRSFADIADLNAQADAWCRGTAIDRRCPGDPSKTVREAFTEEAPRLLTLPDHPYPIFERKGVYAHKTPYVRFDLNDYSIPHTHVRRMLTLIADLEEVRVLDGHNLLARHVRSYDKGAQIEDPAHIAALVADKHAARRHRAIDHLASAAPASEALARDVPHPNAVRLVLDRRRQERHEPPPIAVTLPEHVRAKDRPVTSHSLDTYDQLKETPDAD
jgi:transposase